MRNAVETLLGRRIGNTRVVPLVSKILLIFTIFLLASNFATNYINLTLNRGQQIQLLNQLLVKGLKDLYIFCNNQYQIYTFNNDLKAAVTAMSENGLADLKASKSVALGVKQNGDILFQASKTVKFTTFTDKSALKKMVASISTDAPEGSINFTYGGSQYFGVYKYNPKWNALLIRAEDINEFYAASWQNFKNISFLIVGITLLCVFVGAFLVGFILRYVRVITAGIMKMQEEKVLDELDLGRAPNDDVTYLGVAFNSLSSEIRNLLSIFRKFATQDVVNKAYRERYIRLEGRQEELTILFSDIKGFTYITEMLGTDIIKLLNLHYESAIELIHSENGIIGSIIGDALLAIFGAIPSRANKSVNAIRAGYGIQEVASRLREEMAKRREEIIEQRGALTDLEEDVYRAVLLEVGVGIDGGPVFYGNIGSISRMTNTVIGDNVNAASRLEGLTRIYRVPVICSEFVKNEATQHTDEFEMVELDRVQVKGKTIATQIYWPILKKKIDSDFRKDLDSFNKGLESYYEGQWARASKHFSNCTLPAADEFRRRTRGAKRPKNWNGVWTMTTK